MDDLLRHNNRDTAGRPSSLDDRVSAEIAALHGMDLAALRALWRKLYRTEAPKGFRRELLIRHLRQNLFRRELASRIEGQWMQMRSLF